ncbi:MAG: ADP-forming succinate--CoA ligase subunit beta [Candidatus Eisenbacteria bacterium]|nr:ADP-forming succinate--CoA ligase subunit beta [Candidatus Eisenbacteria bacterium]
MKIHEYQAKELFHARGIPVPRGILARDPAEARRAAERLGGGRVAVKAQVHAGGRGKGGGVRLAGSPDEAERLAAEILSRPLVTPQTGPAGTPVRSVLIEEGCPFERQLYLGIVLDRAMERPVLMASAEGGMDIEEIARTKPDCIRKAHFSAGAGLSPDVATAVAAELGLAEPGRSAVAAVIVTLARTFLDLDCSLIEINPLVLTADGRAIALDAKCNFDDSGLARHEELNALRDREEEDPREAQAAEFGFSYVSLDGNIGCMVNGAGLAMATNDIIAIAGGAPSNFLDVGGAADPARVTAAFKLVLSDARTRAVLVNIFGGIVRCDVIAQGILQALREVELTVPLVVRLEGTNVEEARRMLRESGYSLIEASGFGDAALKAVEAARGGAA